MELLLQERVIRAKNTPRDDHRHLPQKSYDPRMNPKWRLVFLVGDQVEDLTGEDGEEWLEHSRDKKSSVVVVTTLARVEARM